MLGFIVFFIQSTSFAYFFTFFLKNKRKWLTFISILFIINFVISPLAVQLNSSFLIIPVTLFLIYLMLRILFRQENRLRCARAALIYEGVLVCSEAITLTLLLLSDTELHQVSMGIQYHPFYYIFEYILMFLLFSFFIFKYGPDKKINNQYIFWEILLTSLQVVSCIIIFFNYYNVSFPIIFIYSAVYVMLGIVFIKILYNLSQQRKAELTSKYIEEQLRQQCAMYIEMKNQEHFRRLRHDYLNFMAEKNNSTMEENRKN